MTENEYRECFGLTPENIERAKKALEHALDIRKFEIGLYWQRAAYFWTLIAAAFAGYFAILSAEHLAEKKYLAFIVACIGLLFTWAWFLVNRGSKYWQENWENHVDMLEDIITGPLYKTVLRRPTEKENKEKSTGKKIDIIEKLVTGPVAISASKINQWVSLFTFFIWLVLIWNTIEIDFQAYSLKYTVVGFASFGFGLLMLCKGKTYKGVYDHIAEKRETKII